MVKILHTPKSFLPPTKGFFCEIMEKRQLINKMINTKVNLCFVLSSIVVLSLPETHAFLDERFKAKGEELELCNYVGKILKDSTSRDIHIKQFLLMGLRTFHKELFEMIKNYCDDTKQMNLLKEEKWYHFARLIRNCLSHDNKFVFSPFDKSLLPLSWKDKTITLDMDGKILMVSDYDLSDHFKMYEEMINFVKFKLN